MKGTDARRSRAGARSGPQGGGLPRGIAAGVLIGGGLLALAAAGCMTGAERGARDALERAYAAVSEADETRPTRGERNTYSFELRQAQERLGKRDWHEAERLADKATEDALAIRDARDDRRRKVIAALAAVHRLAETARLERSASIDDEMLFAEVGKRVDGTREAYEARDYDEALRLAEEARLLLERRRTVFHRGAVPADAPGAGEPAGGDDPSPGSMWERLKRSLAR